jgi:phosphatidylglycerol---prolipoprotein diacylglyceryl transferase
VITSYPLVFTIGSLHITGFGLTMMLAFLIGGWLIDKECRRLGFAPDYAGDIVLGALVGGIVGAKLWFVGLHPSWDALFSRGGLVWYGGFTGGAIGVVLVGWWRRVPVRWTAQLVAPALAAAYAMGRVGCFVIGDDYGRPTSLPWAVRFPQGFPATTAANLRAFNVALPASIAPDTVLAVHPTQLYEITIMLVVFALLWRWRLQHRGTGWLFGAYLVFAGLERFAVEFLRAKDDRVLHGMTIAQAASVVAVIVGVIVWRRLKDRAPIPPGEWLQRTAASTATP